MSGVRNNFRTWAVVLSQVRFVIILVRDRELEAVPFKKTPAADASTFRCAQLTFVRAHDVHRGKPPTVFPLATLPSA